MAHGHHIRQSEVIAPEDPVEMPRRPLRAGPTGESSVHELYYWFRGILLSGQRGQGLAEYALILALIAVISIAALVFLGTRVSTILSTIGARI
jgi:Flp pilus assembly pilin Flp